MYDGINRLSHNDIQPRDLAAFPCMNMNEATAILWIPFCRMFFLACIKNQFIHKSLSHGLDPRPTDVDRGKKACFC